jgi:SAM-dependent methyltransferase
MKFNLMILAESVYRFLVRLIARHPNLIGDRDVEWSWVAAHMPSGPGKALDFGPGGSPLGLMAAEKGFEVTALDLEPVRWPYRHAKLHFLQGDILDSAARDAAGSVDLVINCSTVEHVGIAGRYGVEKDRPDGDLKAMANLSRLMKPGGKMLLTVPVGEDALFSPVCRVYGRERLPRLLEGFEVEKESYWVKDESNRWVSATKTQALAFKASMGSLHPLRNVCALGCFVLRRRL